MPEYPYYDRKFTLLVWTGNNIIEDFIADLMGFIGHGLGRGGGSGPV